MRRQSPVVRELKQAFNTAITLDGVLPWFESAYSASFAVVFTVLKMCQPEFRDMEHRDIQAIIMFVRMYCMAMVLSVSFSLAQMAFYGLSERYIYPVRTSHAFLTYQDVMSKYALFDGRIVGRVTPENAQALNSARAKFLREVSEELGVWADLAYRFDPKAIAGSPNYF